MEIKIVGAILSPELPSAYVNTKIKGHMRYFYFKCNGHPIFVYCDVPLLLLPIWRKYIPDYDNIVTIYDNGKIDIRLVVNGKGNIYTVDVEIQDDLYMDSDYFFYRAKSI